MAAGPTELYQEDIMPFGVIKEVVAGTKQRGLNALRILGGPVTRRLDARRYGEAAERRVAYGRLHQTIKDNIAPWALSRKKDKQARLSTPQGWGLLELGAEGDTYVLTIATEPDTEKGVMSHPYKVATIKVGPDEASKSWSPAYMEDERREIIPAMYSTARTRQNHGHAKREPLAASDAHALAEFLSDESVSEPNPLTHTRPITVSLPAPIEV